MASAAGVRQPVLFLTHGGGPMPLLGEANHRSLAAHWRGLAATLPARPAAILVVSAHWEERQPTLTTAARPPMLYDYYGFPPEAYTVQYPAPGHPELARTVASLLKKAGFQPAEDAKRGFDHGTFVPLKLIFPDADIPVLTLSMLAGYDPQRHLDLGAALSPLRGQGVLIVGSGSTYHNFAGFTRGGGSGTANADSLAFDAWLQQTLVRGELSPAQRLAQLAAWERAPCARQAQPQEDHLMPLHVALGAAQGERAQSIFSDVVMGTQLSSFAWA